MRYVTNRNSLWRLEGTCGPDPGYERWRSVSMTTRRVHERQVGEEASEDKTDDQSRQRQARGMQS